VGALRSAARGEGRHGPTSGETRLARGADSHTAVGIAASRAGSGIPATCDKPSGKDGNGSTGDGEGEAGVDDAGADCVTVAVGAAEVLELGDVVGDGMPVGELEAVALDDAVAVALAAAVSAAHE
jgi:hypothetical protein